jgi:hypothetical protein
MRIIISILFFYKKLVVPSLTVAMALNFPEWLLKGVFPFDKVVMAYFFMSLCFHYFIYEKRNPNEYYFYYNMGLSKYILWGSTFFLSLTIVFILAIGWKICR